MLIRFCADTRSVRSLLSLVPGHELSGEGGGPSLPGESELSQGQLAPQLLESRLRKVPQGLLKLLLVSEFLVAQVLGHLLGDLLWIRTFLEPKVLNVEVPVGPELHVPVLVVVRGDVAAALEGRPVTRVVEDPLAGPPAAPIAAGLVHRAADADGVFPFSATLLAVHHARPEGVVALHVVLAQVRLERRPQIVARRFPVRLQRRL
mmetsp:Transcript_11276/g.28593  ORF Transcript_11276/g.28593 Transcript_11276/m.28593 type:complete len:205 (+) Transcript_11276:1318-1932(+)